MLPLFTCAYSTLRVSVDEAWNGLKRAPGFYVQERAGILQLARLRALPSRGFTRLLLPRVITSIRKTDNGLRATFGLDAVAVIMLVILLGATIVEFTMSRELYPREYPPELIVGLVIVYLLAIVYDVVVTTRAMNRLLA